MARTRSFLDVDVVTAAKRRLRHVFDVFDTVVVQFSGGKDSLVCLHLVKQVQEELGIKGPVRAIFRDEELLPDEVIDFVALYRELPWLELRWYVVPTESHKFILGKHFDYLQWGDDHEWTRQPPSWAIRGEPGKTYNQHTMDEFMAEGYRGKLAFVLGIRASESLTRYRSVVNKLNENYIASSSMTRVKLVKPIYDWQENDVMKWLAESGIDHCPIYTNQHLSGGQLRVATPLHAENAKRLGILKTQAPEFYDRVMKSFPEMEVQARYYNDIDFKSELEPYLEDGWDGCQRYIDDNITDPRVRARAIARLKESKGAAVNDPVGFTPAYLLKVLSSGALDRGLLPRGGRAARPTA